MAEKKALHTYGPLVSVVQPDEISEIKSGMEKILQVVNLQNQQIDALNKKVTQSTSSSSSKSHNIPQSLTQLPRSFAQALGKQVAQTLNATSSPSTSSSTGSPTTRTNVPYDTKKTIVLSNASDKPSLSTKSIFHQKFSQFFPDVRLINSVPRPSGIIFLNMYSEEEACHVLANWVPTYFGTDTKVNMLRKHSTNAVIIKHVPTSIPESQSLLEIQKKFPSANTVTRFTKKENIPMEIVKIDLDRKSVV
jgi:hypothetical protein